MAMDLYGGSVSSNSCLSVSAPPLVPEYLLSPALSLATLVQVCYFGSIFYLVDGVAYFYRCRLLSEFIAIMLAWNWLRIWKAPVSNLAGKLLPEIECIKWELNSLLYELMFAFFPSFFISVVYRIWAVDLWISSLTASIWAVHQYSCCLYHSASFYRILWSIGGFHFVGILWYDIPYGFYSFSRLTWSLILSSFLKWGECVEGMVVKITVTCMQHYQLLPCFILFNKYSSEIFLFLFWFIQQVPYNMLFTSWYFFAGVTISFILAGAACVLNALCYAELASRFPAVVGGAYLYTYTAFNELTAFLVFAQLMLDYHIGAASIARSLASYLVSLLELFPIFRENIPSWIGHGGKEFFGGALSINILAPILLALLTTVLCWGVKESSTVNSCMTATKVLYVMMCFYLNWNSFLKDACDVLNLHTNIRLKIIRL